MKFCGNCGQQLEDNAVVCSNCGATIGAPVAPQAPVQAEQPVQQTYAQPQQPVQQTYVQPQQPVYIPEPAAAPYGAAPANDDPYPINVTHKGFWSLGFFFGIVGLIMYFVFKNNKPRLAKSALKGFITGLIVSAVIGLISSIPLVIIMMEELF